MSESAGAGLEKYGFDDVPPIGEIGEQVAHYNDDTLGYRVQLERMKDGSCALTGLMTADILATRVPLVSWIHSILHRPRPVSIEYRPDTAPKPPVSARYRRRRGRIVRV